jgi:hypothetical protein
MSKSREYAIVHAMPTQSPEPASDQLRKFQDLARELECDEDEDAFKAAVRKIGTAPREPKAEKPPATD